MVHRITNNVWYVLEKSSFLVTSQDKEQSNLHGIVTFIRKSYTTYSNIVPNY